MFAPATRSTSTFSSSGPQTKVFPALLYLLYAILVFASLQNGFFWDSILLGSRYGQWYYHTNFSYLFVPDDIAGYPPLFGLLVALAWKIFGKTLAVSHLLILPFALAIVWQILALCRKFVSPKLAPFAALLLLLDPTLMAQCTQVAPDVLLVFLYLFSLNKILGNNRGPLIISLLFLGMLSPRGTIAVFLLFATEITLYLATAKENRPALWRIFLSYVPAGLVVLAWQFLHYRHFGWIGYNPDSNWGEYSRFAGLGGMLRNAVIIGWRLLDFGRIFIWFTLLAAAIYLYRKKISLPAKARKLLILVLVPFVGFSFIFLPYTNPIGHRYYLMVFLLFALLVFYLLTLVPNRNFRRGLYLIMVLGLLSGHFWVYPDTVAKGWDASLAHLPYFKLRREAIQYLDSKNIPLEKAGSDYPNVAPLTQTDLLPDNRTFKPKNLETDAYVLYSNVFNGFSDEEIAELKTNWQPVESWKRGQVFLILYKRPE